MHASDQMRSALGDAEALGHFFVEKASAGAVGLNPFAVDNELRDGALAGVLYDFIHSARRRLDVYFGIRNIVLGQEALGFAAVWAPLCGVDGEIHRLC